MHDLRKHGVTLIGRKNILLSVTNYYEENNTYKGKNLKIYINLNPIWIQNLELKLKMSIKIF